MDNTDTFQNDPQSKFLSGKTDRWTSYTDEKDMHHYVELHIAVSMTKNKTTTKAKNKKTE